MKLKNWKNLFLDYILERGYEYYLDGNVYDLNFDGTTFKASVEGSDTYNVEIDVENNKVVNMDCDCPYANGHASCKHMAAVLYQIEDFDISNNNAPNFEELEKELNKISKDELVDYLIDLAKEKNEIYNDIILTFASTNNMINLASYRKELNNIKSKFMNRDNYQIRNLNGNIVSELENFYYQRIIPLTEKTLYNEAYQLAIELKDILSNVEPQDEEYILELVYSLHDFLEDISENVHFESDFTVL